MVAARKELKKNIDERLSELHYNNVAPVTDLLDAFSFDQDNMFFSTVDQSMWRVWQLGMFNHDVLSDDEKTAISNAFALALNYFPDGSSGQIIKFKHNNIRPVLYNFAASQSENQFGRDLMNAICQRQIDGATKGFLKKLTKRQLDEALNELTEETQDDEFKNQLTESLERSITTGQYAHMSELYLAFRYVPKYSPDKRSLLRTITESVTGFLGASNIKQKLHDEVTEEIRQFQLACKRIETRLQGAHFNPHRLRGQALINIYFREFNPDRALRGRPPEFNPSLTIREQVYDAKAFRRREIPEHALFTEIEPRRNGIKINDTYYVPVSLTSLPRSFHPGMLHAVLSEQQGEGWAVINFHVPKQGKIRLRAKSRMMMLKSQQSLMKMLPFEMGNEELDSEKLQDLQTLQNATDPESADRLKALEMSCHIVFKGQDEQELIDKCRQMESDLWDKGYYEEERGDAIVHHCIPLNFRPRAQKVIARSNTNLTPFVADLSPLYGAYQGLPDGDIIMNNSDGQPIFISQLGDHVQAGHTLVVGGTGSGKSFFVSNILQQYKARHRTKIIMIDKGFSYESTNESYDGQYIYLSLSEVDGRPPPCINPFHLPTKDDGTPTTPTDEEVSFMQSILIAMMRTGEEQGIDISIKKPDANLLTTALKECLAERVGTEQVTITKIINHLRNKHAEAGERIASMLTDYQRNVGIYGQLFDGELDVSWDNDFIVVETDRVSNSPAMPVIMMVLFWQINMYFKYKLPPDVVKILGIDEAWAALANPSVAQAVTGYILELRKYNAFVMLISQTIAHFSNLASASAKKGQAKTSSGLLENIFHFFFLACSHADHVMAKELFNLTDEEIATWASVSSLPPFFSEIFYRYRTKSDDYIPGKIRLYSNPISYWTSTTHPKDKPLRSKYAEKYMGKGFSRAEAKRRAVSHLARLHPYGARFSVEDL